MRCCIYIDSMPKHSSGTRRSTQIKPALQSCEISQPVSSESLQRSLLNEIFQLDIQNNLVDLAVIDAARSTFFQRYHLLCGLAVIREPRAATVTHWQLLEVINITRRNSESRFELHERVRKSLDAKSSDDLGFVLLDLAATTWLMISIADYLSFLHGDVPIHWDNGESIKNGLIKRYLCKEDRSNDSVKLSPMFTVEKLE